MQNQLHTLFNQFDADTQADSFIEVGSGHIHQTFRVIPAIQNHPGFILQKFNTSVFPNYQDVMENTLMVTKFLKDKSDFGGLYQISHPIKTISGSWHVIDESSNVWRLLTRITPGISYDAVPNETVALEAGKIFGTFLSELNDFPVQRLHEVIPDFHSLNMRYQQLLQSIDSNASNRLVEVKEEIIFAKKMQGILQEIPSQYESGNLTKRVTHNDTKLNNIIFDESNCALAVIDLDTIMPGLSLYDFGDLVRTAAIYGREDSPEISFSLPLFKAITEGYLRQMKSILTPAELELLPLAPQYMAYIIGIRFLTDYLNGDIYYKVDHPKHNIQRARSQFRLLKSMTANFDECVKVVKSC